MIYLIGVSAMSLDPTMPASELAASFDKVQSRALTGDGERIEAVSLTVVATREMLEGKPLYRDRKKQKLLFLCR